tara:strand:+ start:1321 stop:2100 length:780 start_codon:yes stop_codon:yes gene_type:complete
LKKKLEYFLQKNFKKTTSECGDEIVKHIKHGKKKTKFFSTLNTNSLLILEKDKQFKKAIIASNWVLPDGYGVVFACKLLGLIIKERITGSDIFNDINYKLNKQKKCKYFFLGSTTKNLKLISKKMKLDYPNIKITGYLSPPFKTAFSKTENIRMIKYINRKKTEVLWIGLTQPKQEKWVYENCSKLNVKFIGSIGAVFDFYTGKIKRAPKFLRFLGFEWLYRVLQDPKRLWKRYLYSNINFILKIVPYLLYLRIKNFKF